MRHSARHEAGSYLNVMFKCLLIYMFIHLFIFVYFSFTYLFINLYIIHRVSFGVFLLRFPLTSKNAEFFVCLFFSSYRLLFYRTKIITILTIKNLAHKAPHLAFQVTWETMGAYGGL